MQKQSTRAEKGKHSAARRSAAPQAPRRQSGSGTTWLEGCEFPMPQARLFLEPCEDARCADSASAQPSFITHAAKLQQSSRNARLHQATQRKDHTGSNLGRGFCCITATLLRDDNLLVGDGLLLKSQSARRLSTLPSACKTKLSEHIDIYQHGSALRAGLATLQLYATLTANTQRRSAASLPGPANPGEVLRPLDKRSLQLMSNVAALAYRARLFGMRSHTVPKQSTPIRQGLPKSAAHEREGDATELSELAVLQLIHNASRVKAGRPRAEGVPLQHATHVFNVLQRRNATRPPQHTRAHCANFFRASRHTQSNNST